MDLIKVNYSPTQVPHSKQKKLSFSLHDMTIPTLEGVIKKKTEELREMGFDLFLLEFSSDSDSNGDAFMQCHVKGSRLETPEEVEERVKRQEAYNSRQIKEHTDKLLNSKRLKEIKRLTEHLSLEELQARKTL